MTMSETAISRLAISSPFAVRTLRLRLFLLTFVSLKLPEVFRLTSRCCGVVVLGSRPRSFSGHSILTISAPKAPEPARRPGTRPHPAKVDDPNTRQSLHARNAFFCHVQLSSISSRRISTVNHWCAAAPNKRSNYAPSFRPLSLASAAEYRSGIQQGRQTMTDLPKHVDIHEEGPREGFQIEPGPISTADKIRLIEALAETGLHHIQAGSFVNPRHGARAGRMPRRSSPASPRSRASTTPRSGSTRTG